MTQTIIAKKFILVYIVYRGGDSMDSKEYTITEITEIVGVSKATVYNKILTFQDILRNHINVRKGTKYVDPKGLEIIKNSIGVSKSNFNPPEIIDENHLIRPMKNIAAGNRKSDSK